VASTVGRDFCAAGPTTRANRAWWDSAAADYQAEHGDFLGDVDFCWGPEGLRESAARLLGPISDALVLEIGCGAAQCSRWLRSAGARPLGVDISPAQLRHARTLDERTGIMVPVLAADATHLPLRDASFDLACSAYGALPFVADAAAVHREVARVLRPGGRWVFSVTHPIRWCLPDDPGPGGLTVRDSYFDRRAYVECDADGRPSYVEHHRTLGDHVRQVVAAGLELLDLVEPEWPDGHERTWGGWSPLRGRLVPGTAIFVTRRPPAP
jgi:SAM-dependent methyltransferase